jgi:hypothetical protein
VCVCVCVCVGLTLPDYLGYLTGNPIFVCSVQASGTVQLPEAAQTFILNTRHPPRCEPLPACPRYCRKAPIGHEHALSCFTIQLTRILTLGNRVVPVCLAIVCVCVCASYRKAPMPP